MKEEVFWRIYFLLLLNKTAGRSRRKEEEAAQHSEALPLDMTQEEAEAFVESRLARRGDLADLTPSQLDCGIVAEDDSYFVLPS
jgi:hypothetical protein